MSENYTTITISVPEGVDLKLGPKINVQGIEVDCHAIAWEENSIGRTFALEQRLEVALELLEDGKYSEKDIDGYRARLEELKNSGELIGVEQSDEAEELVEFDD